MTVFLGAVLSLARGWLVLITNVMLGGELLGCSAPVILT